MSGFNDFMDKAGAFASKAAGKAKDLASVAAAKTKQVSRVAKLNMDVSSQKDVIKKAYTELGQLYYEAHHDAPEPALAAACGQIDEAQAAIAALEEEIARIKQTMDEQAEDADFESVVDKTEAEADVIVQIVEEELHVPTSAGPEAPAEPETPAEPGTPAEPEAPAEPEEDKPAE